MIHSLFFFFNDTATTEIYTLSLHDALPIYFPLNGITFVWNDQKAAANPLKHDGITFPQAAEARSEEHTSELQSLTNLVCRLLLEKKNMQSSSIKKTNSRTYNSRTEHTTQH